MICILNLFVVECIRSPSVARCKRETYTWILDRVHNAYGTTCRDDIEKKYEYTLLDRRRSVYEYRRAFSQAVATSMPKYKLIRYEKRIKEPYIDVDMRGVLRILCRARIGSRVCRPILQIRSQFTVGLDDMGRRLYRTHVAQRVCCRNTAMVENSSVRAIFLINVCDECNDIDVMVHPTIWCKVSTFTAACCVVGLS
jgi:hypothetical protein